MHLLINAGPTREYFDSVRFLSNASSGRMGFALAAAAARRGHRVALVAGPVELPTPAGVSRVDVVSADQMFRACVRHFDESDLAILCAAVCDYRPAQRSEYKLKKDGAGRTIELEPTVDILAHLGALKQHRKLIGFALEDQQAEARAEEKLARKACDAIVLNGPATLGEDTASIRIFVAGGGWSPVHAGTKPELATVILDVAEALVTRDTSR